ncbi:MAG: hypothetical protein AB4206_05865 [Xenococcaceae cyanobacterium]
MSICPCCSDKLLAHIRREKMIWFCPTCRQEMPNFDWYKTMKSDRSVRTCIKYIKIAKSLKLTNSK